jgi:Tfp pilus assembly protein PilN
VASSTTGPLRLTKLYIATLLGLAVLLTVGQLITQWQFDKFQDEILLIRNTALQRHQSQQIAKKALLLNEQRDIAAFKATQKSIQQLEGSIRQHFVLGQIAHQWSSVIPFSNFIAPLNPISTGWMQVHAH